MKGMFARLMVGSVLVGSLASSVGYATEEPGVAGVAQVARDYRIEVAGIVGATVGATVAAGAREVNGDEGGDNKHDLAHLAYLWRSSGVPLARQTQLQEDSFLVSLASSEFHAAVQDRRAPALAARQRPLPEDRHSRKMSRMFE